MPAGTSAPREMLHGRCQPRLTQPKPPCSVPLRGVHPGPQPDAGTRGMSARLPLAAPGLCTHPGITTGVHFCGNFPCQPGLEGQIWGGGCVPAMQRGEMLHLWSPASLERGWGGCGTSKNLAFLASPRVADFPW